MLVSMRIVELNAGRNDAFGVKDFGTEWAQRHRGHVDVFMRILSRNGQLTRLARGFKKQNWPPVVEEKPTPATYPIGFEWRLSTSALPLGWNEKWRMLGLCKGNHSMSAILSKN